MTDDVTTLRLRLRECGYDPIPLEGKIPPMEGWTDKLAVTADEVRLWDRLWQYARNTGVLSKRTPTADIDILQEDAAVAIEALGREFFGERGDVILLRIGLPPKRLIRLRTDEPFKKLRRIFTAPNGAEHKIEILGDGQQWVRSAMGRRRNSSRHGQTIYVVWWRADDDTARRAAVCARCRLRKVSR